MQQGITIAKPVVQRTTLKRILHSFAENGECRITLMPTYQIVKAHTWLRMEEYINDEVSHGWEVDGELVVVAMPVLDWWGRLWRSQDVWNDTEPRLWFYQRMVHHKLEVAKD